MCQCEKSSETRLASFPSISEEEFKAACIAFELRCHDRLTGTDWLSVSVDKAGLSITKAIPAAQPSHEPEADVSLKHQEDQSAAADEAFNALQPSPATYAALSVLRSPTYQVPILWLNVHGLPVDGPQGLDAIYHHLVPKSLYPTIRDIGVLGGISFGSHPVTSLPAFFIHPCNTQEALRDVSSSALTPERYLLLWLGLIGPCVGLHVPLTVMRG